MDEMCNERVRVFYMCRMTEGHSIYKTYIDTLYISFSIVGWGGWGGGGEGFVVVGGGGGGGGGCGLIKTLRVR